PSPSDDSVFFENLDAVKKKITSFEERQKALREDEVSVQMEIRSSQEEYESIHREIESLKKRKSNIPARMLDLRSELCRSINIPGTRLPFAGELIEVRENESSWEGAIERLLHNFGQSILVPDELYKAVSEYVEKTNLRGRIVYYRIKDKRDVKPGTIEPGHLLNKIRIRPDSEFYSWLDEEIRGRFDFICCSTLEDFRHQPKAITEAGQIKSGGTRHEKDDRHSIQDRSRYILGWKNEQKIALLQQNLENARKNGAKIVERAKRIVIELNELQKLRDSGRDISGITQFSEIDWQSTALRIEECVSEMREITSSADILRTLKEQLSRIEKEIEEKRLRTSELQNRSGALEKEVSDSIEASEKAERNYLSIEEPARIEFFPRIDILKEKGFPDKKITLQNAESFQRELREYIQRQADNITEQNRRRAERIVKQMQVYCDTYKAETSEIDASVEAAGEYRKILDNLISEDLPKHEERFRRLLREGTIQDIALFQNRMEKERLEIINKITTINKSLREIEYNRGSYITLIPDRTIDQEIRQFQEDLRLCLGETLSGDEGEAYTEEKFAQVKALIDRFRGREGVTEADRRWTDKVTDVRNWFLFSASERWVEDDSEREFYSDSSGKSGGQKEKLAYTILAAALAFQFSLGQEGLWNRSFRFVMIDEAFGRGSDESARYGLELFGKLQLQLLIVTPLQK
ncbi:MAG TPA: SbcC/MukB-like Walker B domain-containing protein, partial [Spirochaetota bacterium]|nr:SbcC/MukB-like Walker B domain-containing protein [Spirochaetota bacterium]